MMVMPRDHVAHFQAALDALESCQRRADRVFADALSGGECRCGCCVQRVVLAGQLHFKLGPKRAVVPDFPLRRAVDVAQVADPPVALPP